MVIVKLSGGLGNQMFQYSLGRYLSYKNKKPLMLDKKWFNDMKGCTKRKYSLDIFNIIDTKDDNKKSGLFDNLNKIFQIDNIKKITERSFCFDKNILKLKGNLVLDGYWQSEKYFIGIKEIIKKDFTINIPPDDYYSNLINNLKNEKSVSLHIRRGDYVTDNTINKVHGLCDIDYYNNAIKYFCEKIVDPVFYVFSDDINWAKENIKINKKIIFVNNENKDYEDLRLMSLCDNNIIANSSFSWWGAWLNNNPDKIIIAPKKWFNDSIYDTKDLIPESWIKI